MNEHRGSNKEVEELAQELRPIEDDMRRYFAEKQKLVDLCIEALNAVRALAAHDTIRNYSAVIARLENRLSEARYYGD